MNDRQIENFKIDFAIAFVALDKNGHNYVLIHDLRKALAYYSAEEFDQGLHELRKARKFTCDNADGRHVRLTREQITGGVFDKPSNSWLVYVARRV